MKKALVLTLTMVLVLSFLTACRGNDNANGDGNNGIAGGGTSKNGGSQKSSLDLSIEVDNVTLFGFRGVHEEDFLYIADDGTLHYANYGGNGWGVTELLLDNVRSIAHCGATNSLWDVKRSVVYAIQNDNSLWARGANYGGLVGDGTGVDREEFVKIADNVADVIVPSSGVTLVGAATTIYAIKTDKTLWRWGAGKIDGTIFAPEMIEENVVRHLQENYFLCGDGTVIDVTRPTLHYGDEIYFVELGIENVVDAYCVGKNYQNNTTEWYTLSADGRFCKTITQQGSAEDSFQTEVIAQEEICADVKRMMVYDVERHNGRAKLTMHVLKNDNSLWGMGENQFGQIGNGTKITQDELIPIAEDVRTMGLHATSYGGGFGPSSCLYYIKTDGSLWAWTVENPTPQQQGASSVSKLFFGGNGYVGLDMRLNVLLQDGTVVYITDGTMEPICSFDFNKDSVRDEEQLTDVMLPSALVFE